VGKSGCSVERAERRLADVCPVLGSCTRDPPARRSATCVVCAAEERRSHPKRRGRSCRGFVFTAAASSRLCARAHLLRAERMPRPPDQPRLPRARGGPRAPGSGKRGKSSPRVTRCSGGMTSRACSRARPLPRMACWVICLEPAGNQRCSTCASEGCSAHSRAPMCKEPNPFGWWSTLAQPTYNVCLSVARVALDGEALC